MTKTSHITETDRFLLRVLTEGFNQLARYYKTKGVTCIAMKGFFDVARFTRWISYTPDEKENDVRLFAMFSTAVLASDEEGREVSVLVLPSPFDASDEDTMNYIIRGGIVTENDLLFASFSDSFDSLIKDIRELNIALRKNNYGSDLRLVN